MKSWNSNETRLTSRRNDSCIDLLSFYRKRSRIRDKEENEVFYCQNERRRKRQKAITYSCRVFKEIMWKGENVLLAGKVIKQVHAETGIKKKETEMISLTRSEFSEPYNIDRIAWKKFEAFFSVGKSFLAFLKPMHFTEQFLNLCFKFSLKIEKYSWNKVRAFEKFFLKKRQPTYQD